MDKLHFDDPQKINCALGLLTKEARDMLFDWPHGWEFLNSNGEWARAENFSVWHLNMTYRARPAPLTQDVVPWDALADWVQCVARDSDGLTWAFGEAPELGASRWIPASGTALMGTLFKGYQRGTVDWTDSLQQRPEGV